VLPDNDGFTSDGALFPKGFDCSHCIPENILTYGELGDTEEPEVVGDGADDDGDLPVATVLLHVTSESGQRHRGSVDPRHEEALQDDAVELGIGTAGQEPVELESVCNVVNHRAAFNISQPTNPFLELWHLCTHCWLQFEITQTPTNC